MRSKVLVVGVAGGSGSGKTTVVSRILRTLGPERVARVEQDAYYRHLPQLSPEERARRNYDHPDAIDEELLLRHVDELRRGLAIEGPVYDFVRHERTGETRRLEPRPCVVVDGILILANPALRGLLDLKLFVETDPDVRFIRRLRRDISERGRTVESVTTQWEDSVRPMHLQFVEPSKRYADLIIPEGGHNEAALEVILGHLAAAVGPAR
ncbi:MAG: uridine kinase [Armatimonadota bacterium]